MSTKQLNHATFPAPFDAGGGYFTRFALALLAGLLRAPTTLRGSWRAAGDAELRLERLRSEQNLRHRDLFGSGW